MTKLLISLSIFLFAISQMTCIYVPWKYFPKLTKYNYQKKYYGYKEKMYLPKYYQGDYTNEHKYMGPIMKYYKSHHQSSKFPISGQSYGDSGYGHSVDHGSYGNDHSSYGNDHNSYGKDYGYGGIMSQEKYWLSISKYVNKSSYNSYLYKMNHGNKYGMKKYNSYKGNQCSYNSYQYSHMCGEYNYCCYWNSSKHMYYYLYKMYYYSKSKYGCKKAKMYSTRLGYKMLNKSPYWYQKYNWKKIPEIVYSYKC